jgi:hypothetical protein
MSCHHQASLRLQVQHVRFRRSRIEPAESCPHRLRIEVNGKSYLAWQVGSDDYITPEPNRYARRIQDNGPVADFTTVNITCNQGGNIPSKGAVPVNAGDKVKLVWDQWGSSHSGPVMSMRRPVEQDSNGN